MKPIKNKDELRKEVHYARNPPTLLLTPPLSFCTAILTIPAAIVIPWTWIEISIFTMCAAIFFLSLIFNSITTEGRRKRGYTAGWGEDVDPDENEERVYMEQRKLFTERRHRCRELLKEAKHEEERELLKAEIEDCARWWQFYEGCSEALSERVRVKEIKELVGS